MVDALDISNEADNELANRLRDVLGDLFAEKLIMDAAWSRAVLNGMSDASAGFH